MRRNPVLEEMGTYPIAELQEQARALRDAGEPVIDFSIGDPAEPTPDFVKNALKAAIPAVSQYPTVPGLALLRRAVAAYVKRRFGVDVDPDTQVLPTSGSKEAIFHTPFAFVDPGAGSTVVYGSPAYPVYERGARFAGAEPVAVPLGGDFVLRADDIPDDVWGRAALVWTCSPHNPTGSVTPGAELARLVGRARRARALLCSDECYTDIYQGTPPVSALEVAGPGARGVLSFLSCSKRSGMTGYRSGAIVGDAQAIAALRVLRGSTGTASPEFIQAAAVAAWSDDAHAAERRAVFAEKRDVLKPVLEELGFRVAGSQAAIFLWAEVGDDVAVAKRLLGEHVVVSPGRIFGPGGEGYIRLALVPTVEECRHAGEVIRRCLTTRG